MSSILTAQRLLVALLSALAVLGTAPPPASAVPGDRATTGLDERIADASRRLEVIVEKYDDARDDLRTTEARRRALGARLAPMNADLSRRQQVIDGLVTRTYQRTRGGPAVALFASSSPHQFVDGLLVLNQLTIEQQRSVADLQQARARIADTRGRLDALAAQQHRLRTQLSTRKATVEGEIAALEQMRTAAFGGGGGSRYGGAGDRPAPPHVPGPAGRVVAFAFAQLGKPYRWGADGPGSYDCSGLTLAAWHTAGVGLPHNAARQYAVTARLGRDDLRPGDLVFFYAPISHVGIYIGDGRMIHAPEHGENVRVASVDSLPVHGYGRPG